MLPRLSSLFGYSLPGQSQNRFDGYAEIYLWEDGPAASAGIISMKVVCDGVEEYLHFGPENMEGVADRAWNKLSEATEGDFIASFEDATLLEGFRRRPDLYDKETFYTMGDNKKLDLAKNLAPELQTNIKQTLGHPNKTIRLTNLKVHTMLSEIKALKKHPPSFAIMSGSAEGPTANNASIIMRVLQAGGADKIAPPLNEELTRLDLDYLAIPVGVLGAVTAGPLTGLAYSLCSVLAARVAGSTIEGHKAASSLITLMKKENKMPCYLPVGLSLDLLYSAVSGIAGSFAPGSAPMRLSILPEDVLKHVQTLERAPVAECCADMRTLHRLSPC